MNILAAAKALIDATDAFREFEREHPNDSTKRWDAVFEAKVAADEALRACVAEIETALKSRPDKALRTVRDLRLLMAEIDLDDLPDTMPLARRGRTGGSWENGFDDIGVIKLETLGHYKKDRLTVEAGVKIWKNFAGKRSEPFDAIAFD